MSDNLNIDLEQRTDADGNTYYIGRLKCDVTINAKDGLVFLVFVSAPGQEQIQIAPMAPKKDKQHYERYTPKDQ